MKKKNRIWIYILFIPGVFLILTNSCKKEDEPVPAQPVYAKIEASETYSLALKKDGSLWGWGWNSLSRSGSGLLLNNNKPLDFGP